MIIPSVDDVQRAIGDRYEVLDLAGAGGMGAVFRARHSSLGHIVAVKVLPPEAASWMRQERFRREAALAAHLAHPNIVPVYEFDARQGLSFLIMPYVRGVTLESVLDDRRRLAIDEVVRLVRDVGAALDFAHRRGVVHRDVKPSNILIEADTGRALLTDFGVAHVQTPSGTALTAPGSPIGTPDYMAPEQIASGEEVDGRADLYSLAVVAFEALTGTLPSMRVERTALARAVRATRPRVAQRLATALVAPLAERPGDRPATAQAWLELVERARRRWRRAAALGAAGAVVLLGGVWLGRGALSAGGGQCRPAVAVMPFTVLGATPYPASQLPEYFISRFSPVPDLREAVSFGRVAVRTGAQPVSASEADSIARELGACFFLQASGTFVGDTVTLDATLHRIGNRTARAHGAARGPVGTMSDLMDAAWEQILGESFARRRDVTLPRGKEAIAAFMNADDAFRRGDYAGALENYDRVTTADSGFAPARFRRALVIAQTDPTGEEIHDALRGALQHQSGLSPADSTMLEGYALLLERGDGLSALERFRAAAEAAPNDPLVWFVLGEFYTHFGALFNQPLTAALEAFHRALDLSPGFAPAISHLISLTYQRGERAEACRLMREYRKLDSASVVAEVVGIADTVVCGSAGARLHLVNNTLGSRDFTVLAYLAFQAAAFGTDADRQGPGRRVLLELERRASNERERARALRMGLAADLRYGWRDSAEARLRRTGAVGPERELWSLVAHTSHLPALGDWRSAAARLGTRAATDPSPTTLWLLARLGSDRSRHGTALQRLAADSTPLALSLALDLEARAALAHGDTAAALSRWDAATRRYEVLSAPFGLVASLWPIRLDLARVAAAARDTARAVRACATFDALIGYIDQVAQPEAQQLCAPWRALTLPAS